MLPVPEKCAMFKYMSTTRRQVTVCIFIMNISSNTTESEALNIYLELICSQNQRKIIVKIMARLIENILVSADKIIRIRLYKQNRYLYKILICT